MSLYALTRHSAAAERLLQTSEELSHKFPLEILITHISIIHQDIMYVSSEPCLYDFLEVTKWKYSRYIIHHYCIIENVCKGLYIIDETAFHKRLGV